jgi:hypothetical protein
MENPIPEKFEKIISDFVGDIITTFPEYDMLIKKWFSKPDWIETIYTYCLTVFPERFMDILYKNVEIFGKDSTVNTDFLPGISFRYLWQCDISDSTKETIWRYLQLISVTIVAKGDNNFSDTSKIFDAINETEFKEKLTETLEKMQSIFTSNENPQDNATTSDPDSSSTSESNSGLPSPDDMNEHIQGMMGGKLGDLAREIAEETAGNFTNDMENATNANDVFQKLFQNPGKLMGLVKNVGEKLDSRIKSGDIKESELLSEATELMGKMQNMPGMDNIQEMMAKMGLGKKAKVNTAAMEARMNQMQKSELLKEQLRKNAQEKKAKAMAEAMTQLAKNNASTGPALSDEQLVSIFSTGEKVEKTPVSTTSQGKKKKGKGKK